MSVEVTYGGKSFKSISDGLKAALADQMKMHFENSLRPFLPEIHQNNGRVIIDIPENLKGIKVEIFNVPNDMVKRIKDAVSGDI